MDGDKMTERTVSREDVEKALKWAEFVGKNLDKFREYLDFAIEFLKQASLISSHYDDDALYSFFAKDSAKYFYDLARSIGDEIRAKKFEEIIKGTKEIEKQRKWDWTREQASKEWSSFVKENEEKFIRLIYFLENELQKVGSDETMYAARIIYNMAYSYEDFPRHYAEFEWKQFLYDSRDKFKGLLDFAFKFLKQASLISSHYDEDGFFSFFVRNIGTYFYNLAGMIENEARAKGDEASAKEFEEIRNKIVKLRGEDEIAKQLRDKAPATKIEKIRKETIEIVKQRKEWDWTEEQASKEWYGFVKENVGKFGELLNFLEYKLQPKAESIKAESINPNFADETNKCMDIIYDEAGLYWSFKEGMALYELLFDLGIIKRRGK